MILSEQTRRWSEIQFYYFCLNLYDIRHNMIDVILMIEVIAQIAQLNYPMLKHIAAQIIGNPNYIPNRDEVIVLANMHGYKPADIVRATKLSKSKVLTTLNSKKDKYIPYPQFDITEDQELYKFNEIFKTIKKAGI